MPYNNELKAVLNNIERAIGALTPTSQNNGVQHPDFRDILGLVKQINNPDSLAQEDPLALALVNNVYNYVRALLPSESEGAIDCSIVAIMIALIKRNEKNRAVDLFNKYFSDRHISLINFTTQSGITPLHIASFMRDEPLMKYLLDKGALRHETTRDKLTPITVVQMVKTFTTNNVNNNNNMNVNNPSNGNHAQVSDQNQGGHSPVHNQAANINNNAAVIPAQEGGAPAFSPSTLYWLQRIMTPPANIHQDNLANQIEDAMQVDDGDTNLSNITPRSFSSLKALFKKSYLNITF